MRTPRSLVAPLLLTLGLGVGLTACAHKPNALEMGLAAVDAGDDVTAAQHFQAAMDDPDTAATAQAQMVELKKREARELLDTDPEGALAIYLNLLEQDPNDHRARMGAGRVHELQRRFEPAIAILTANASCGLCKAQLAEVYEQRGRKHLAAGEYEAARADYDQALAVEREPEILLDISEMYTVGHYGDAMEAARSLNEAHGMLMNSATTLQQLWEVERRDLVLLLAAEGKFDALSVALEKMDPRVALDPSDGARVLEELRLEVTQTLQANAYYDESLIRTKALWSEVEGKYEGADKQHFLDGVLGNYSRHAHHLMTDGEPREAAALLAEALALAPENWTLRFQAVLAMSAVDRDIAEKMMETIPKDQEHWSRVHALVKTSRAQQLLGQGDIAGAQEMLFEAGKEFPDLIEVRLVRAEILAQTQIRKMGTGDRQTLKKFGVVSYPGNVVHRFGEALGEVVWLRSRFAEPAMQEDPIRMPGFATRLSTLEGDLEAVFPFPARRIPGANPRIKVRNDEGVKVSLVIEGPGLETTHDLEPGAMKTFVLEEPGVVYVSIAGTGPEPKEMAWYAEQRTLVTVPVSGKRSTDPHDDDADGDDTADAAKN